MKEKKALQYNYLFNRWVFYVQNKLFYLEVDSWVASIWQVSAKEQGSLSRGAGFQVTL